MSNEKHEGSKAECQATVMSRESSHQRRAGSAELWRDRWQHGVRLREKDESRREMRQVGTERQMFVKPRSSTPIPQASWVSELRENERYGKGKGHGERNFPVAGSEGHEGSKTKTSKTPAIDGGEAGGQQSMDKEEGLLNTKQKGKGNQEATAASAATAAVDEATQTEGQMLDEWDNADPWSEDRQFLDQMLARANGPDEAVATAAAASAAATEPEPEAESRPQMLYVGDDANPDEAAFQEQAEWTAKRKGKRSASSEMAHGDRWDTKQEIREKQSLSPVGRLEERSANEDEGTGQLTGLFQRQEAKLSSRMRRQVVSGM
eukprot:59032-Amphidinium_carterae.2